MNREYRFHLSMVSLVLMMSSFLLAQKAPEIPSGTTIKVRTIDRLSSAEARVGDNFHASLEEPITVNDKELYPRGAEVIGRVVDVHASGRLSEPGELDLVLNTVSSGGRTSSVEAQPWVRSSAQLLVGEKGPQSVPWRAGLRARARQPQLANEN